MINLDRYSQYAPIRVASASSLASVQNTTNQIRFADVLNEKMNAAKTMEDIFTQASQTYQIPKNLLTAIAYAESNFDANAVSHCGAQGVMQLMPQTARSLGVTDSFDAEQNIMGGAKYIRQMLDRYDGDVKLALAAYNAGSGNVDKYGGVPDFKETKDYINKVMKYAANGIDAPDAIVTSSPISDSSSDFALSGVPFSGGYMDLINAVRNYSDYTQEDYQLFIRLLLENMSGRVDSGAFLL